MKSAIALLTILATTSTLCSAQTRPEPAQAAAPATINTNSVITETDLDAPVDKVWNVFTTDEGFKMLGVAKAKIDLRVGGKMQSHYNPDGVIGDEGTIENTIIAYEPLRMLAFRITKPPKGFPFTNAYKTTWSVATFTDLGGGRSHVRLAGMGYTADEESQKMRAFFEQGNAWTMNALRDKLSGKPKGAPAAEAITQDPLAPITVETAVNAMPADVWKNWTTGEGFKAFSQCENKIELKVGGPFEIYFNMPAPEGQRGSEGCKILSYEPESMLSFSWNAPPKLAWAREQRTWVVVRIQPHGAHGSKVFLRHMGFAELAATAGNHSDEVKEAREYFSKAWPSVLAKLAEHYKPK